MYGAANHAETSDTSAVRCSIAKSPPPMYEFSLSSTSTPSVTWNPPLGRSASTPGGSLMWSSESTAKIWESEKENSTATTDAAERSNWGWWLEFQEWGLGFGVWI